MIIKEKWLKMVKKQSPKREDFDEYFSAQMKKKKKKMMMMMATTNKKKKRSAGTEVRVDMLSD